MEILKCPKCGLASGALYFKPKRAGSKLYPKVKHYDPSKKSRESWCNISASNLLQIEFRDSRYNSWKSVLDSKDWYKIQSLASRYSTTDLYLNRRAVEKIRDEIGEIMDEEIAWLKKSTKKPPRIYEFEGHIVKISKRPSTFVKLTGLETAIRKSHQKNNDPNLELMLLYIQHAKMHTAMARRDIDEHIPLERKIRMTGKQKRRILNLHEREALDIFNPKSRDEALMSHFHGTKCPKCKSWRTDLTSDGGFRCKCYACGNPSFEAGIKHNCPQCHLPFFDGIIKKMIQDSNEITDDALITRCIRCNNEIKLLTEHLAIFQTCETS